MHSEFLADKAVMEPWDRWPCSSATENDLDLFTLREVLKRLGSKGAAAEVQRYLSGLDRDSTRGQRLELADTLLNQLRVLLPTVEAESVTLYDKTNRAKPSVQKYPARAIREAVVNSFAHRDYSLADPLRVTAFQDRIEIASPGTLPLGVEAEELAAGTAAPHWRNQTLAWFLSRLGYAEAEGQGTRTIRTSLAAAGCPPAEYHTDAVRVVCTLHAHPRATGRVESP